MPPLVKILVAAITGAVISVVGFGLFVVAHYMLGRQLEAVAVYVYERWLSYVAPIIGGAVGVATVSKVVTRGVYTVAISALIGAVVVPILESITGEKGNRPAGNITGLAVAGMGYGAINGVILAVVFAILRVIGWV